MGSAGSSSLTKLKLKGQLTLASIWRLSGVGDGREAILFRCIQVSSIQLLVVVRLKSLLPCWLLAGGRGQPLEIICVPWLMPNSFSANSAMLNPFPDFLFCHQLQEFSSFVVILYYIRVCVISLSYGQWHHTMLCNHGNNILSYSWILGRRRISLEDHNSICLVLYQESWRMYLGQAKGEMFLSYNWVRTVWPMLQV